MNVKYLVVGGCPGNSRGTSVEIHSLNRATMVSTLACEVAKVFERTIALGTNLERLVAAVTQLLDRALEIDSQRVSRDT